MEVKNNFCGYCGRELADGEICRCRTQENNTKSDYFKISFSKESVKKMRDRITETGKKLNESISSVYNTTSNDSGVSTNNESTGSNGSVRAVDGAFEKDLKIVDTCIVPTETEIPIRQYKIAEMHTPLIKKAFGRLQITNKRIIFRAAGKSFLGPIITEKEFAIEELGGIEIKKDCYFSKSVFFLSLVMTYLLSSLFAFMITELMDASIGSDESIAIGFAVVCSVLSVLVFFMIPRKQNLKAALFIVALYTNIAAYFETLEDICLIIAIIFGAWSIIMLVLSGIVEDLQIIIKIKGAHEVINISRKKGKDERSGFMIVKSWEDTNIAIQELGALITDVKQQGDNAIKKWCV